EIQHLAPVLIERVNSHLGWRCVGRIALRHEPFTPKRKAVRKPPVADPRAQAEAERLAAGIEDVALRAALTRLGTAALGARKPR
ncbi:MAG: hypothetical protein KDA41_14380, partial [Planctomycetales bacterium]|nr:hypothetical protein [Planctomycetales bacterium]